MRYDDDFRDDRYDDGPSHPTLAGMYGFILAMVSLGLIGVVLALWLILREENQMQDDQTMWMVAWFLILDFLSFLAALTAVILGVRGISRSNPLYRGFGIGALILGIVELAVTSVFGLFFFCCSTFLLALRGG